LKEFMKLKLGTDNLDALRAKSAPLRLAGERVGITWNTARKMVNTVKSHCLAELARAQRKGDGMVEEIFTAYFQRGEDINDADVLCRLAEKVGVDGARACLESGTYRAGVQACYESAVRSGVTSVPHFTIRVGVAEPSRFSGAQSPEVIQGVLWQLVQAAEVPLGSRVRVGGRVEGDVVAFQGAEGEQGCFVVKPLHSPRPGGDNVDLIRSSKHNLEVLRTIPLGSEVQLGGLMAADLNGQKGQVVKYHTGTGRFEVRLVGDAGATKALRGDNLTVLRTLLPGDEVILDGLKAAHLNGQKAEVLGYLTDKERFELRLHSNGEVKAIQGERLQRVSE